MNKNPKEEILSYDTQATENDFSWDDIQTRKALLIDRLITLIAPTDDIIEAVANIAKIYEIAESGLFEKFHNKEISCDNLIEELSKYKKKIQSGENH